MNFEYVSTYTRKEAIEDGTLIDVTRMAAEAGFRYPVALTASVWTDCVEWSENDSKRQALQDESGRLWDVLYMAALACRRNPTDTVEFIVYRIPRGGTKRRPSPKRLKAVCGPGDNAEPVITIMQIDED